jgi:hypothetical protein
VEVFTHDQSHADRSVRSILASSQRIWSMGVPHVADSRGSDCRRRRRCAEAASPKPHLGLHDVHVPSAHNQLD